MSGKAETTLVELGKLDDLVMLASMMPVSVVHVYSTGKGWVAFAFFETLLTMRPVVYICRLAEPLEKKFAHVNKVTGAIKYGDEISTDANTVSTPIVKVSSHSLFTDIE